MLLPLCCCWVSPAGAWSLGSGGKSDFRLTRGDHNKTVKPSRILNNGMWAGPNAVDRRYLSRRLNYPPGRRLKPRPRLPFSGWWEGSCSGRSRRRGDEFESIVSSSATHVQLLERILLRRGLGALEAARDCCVDCGRTPLTGEQIHVYAGGEQRIVCELCRPSRRESPLASEIVRHFERGHAVRLTARAA